MKTILSFTILTLLISSTQASEIDLNDISSKLKSQLDSANAGFSNKNIDYTSPDILEASRATRIFDEDALYVYGGKEIGYVSRYPTYDPLRDNEEYFALRQSRWRKLLNAICCFWAMLFFKN